MVNLRTSETHPLQVNFIDRGDLDLPGRIGLTFAPGKKQRGALTGAWDRDLGTDLRTLRDEFQTNLLVSLIEEHELIELQIPNLRKEVISHGMEVLWFPIRDQSVPASIERFYDAVQYIVAILREGKTVVIHCKGGLGRTGLVAAAVLIAITELKPEEAISTVRQARPDAVENSKQEEYIRIFHRHIQAL